MECVKEDRTCSPVLTHEQQGQAIEECANVSQEPHQDCKLKNEMIATASRSVMGKGLISLTFFRLEFEAKFIMMSTGNVGALLADHRITERRSTLCSS